MNRLLILFFSLFIIGCGKQKKIWDNGLTKSAEEITEYTIRIQEDSLKNEIRDTLLIAVKKYRDDDQIAFQTRKTLFDNEQMEIEYVYDYSDRLKQEIVKMSTDSLPFKVNYSYKNSLLFQSSGILDNETERFEQIETHYYRNDDTKEKSIMRQIFLDKKTNDTIRNSTVSTYFNTNEKVDSIYQSIFADKDRTEKPYTNLTERILSDLRNIMKQTLCCQIRNLSIKWTNLTTGQKKR